MSVNFVSFLKTPLLDVAPAAAPALIRNTQRKELFEQQLLKAFSFFLNEQTTPRALWNTHHMVQSQAKNRPFERPQMMQSPTFCAVRHPIQSKPESFFGKAKSFKNFSIKKPMKEVIEICACLSPF